ncbi:MAG TPA: L,D-transpeptidase family protein [Desulfitobacteriaceae bacterium]|nr:L,D-transpeptidase family protein [Desulfitobacteriaceae bacterium]
MLIPEKLNKRPVKLTLIGVFSVFMISVIFHLFFQTHFFLGTIINGVNVSYKTPEEADELLTKLAALYSLELEERGGTKEQIKGSEIGLKFNAEEGSQSLKKKQNRTSSFISLFNHKDLSFSDVLTYDENMFETRYAKLSCVESTEVTETKNATLVYAEDGYKIVKERYGNKIDGDILYSSIRDAVLNNKTKLDLEETKCYTDPTIISDSKKIKDTKIILDKYITAKITYTYPGGSEVADANEIGKWIELDNDLNIIFSSEKMQSFVNRLSSHYDTCGKVRDFVTFTGAAIKIGGGDYGWKVNVNGEIAYLTEAIKNGDTAAREPLYSQTGASHDANDIGDTFVEVDLTRQHLWYHKNSALVAEGDMISGNVSKGHGTPDGIYRLKYKEMNAVLRGEDYSVPVTYWMPFNNNIGIHDATWRTEFGGDIYLTNGSHGCINTPYSVAEAIFNNISAGTPVVCYHGYAGEIDLPVVPIEESADRDTLNPLPGAGELDNY